MENKKLTVFQKINKALSFGNKPTNDLADTIQAFKNNDFIETNSEIEYNEKMLELQQNHYLSSQYETVKQGVYTDSLFYETTRLSSYMDSEAMEYFPEIAAALDIYAEEATSLHDDGNVLKVYSESERVKDILKDLFFDRIDINTTLPSWARNVCKYGDNFVFLKTDTTNGITGVIQLKNIEIARREIDLFDKSNTERVGTVFKWDRKDLEFQNFQIAHFRLTGDDRKLPYGTSILEKSRKIFKQLTLLEDAVLIYRITRAPERRVFKIPVGNIDDADVEAYVARVASKYKKQPLINSENGQLDYRTASIAMDADYFVPTRGNGQNETVIDTLPGGNIGDLGDLTFFQNKLFAALRVPKSFLNFEAAVGDGKSLALQDVRFLKSVQKVQQALIQELNKIAIIHLWLLGFDEELDNFKLTLASPSIQADILRTEQLDTKMDLYLKAVNSADNGFAPYSMTKAKKEILGMTNEEIILDIKQQRMEKIIAIENDVEVLKKMYLSSGIFRALDDKYKSDKPLAGDLAIESGGSNSGGGGGSIPDLGGSPEGGDIDISNDGGELPSPESGGNSEIPNEPVNTPEPPNDDNINEINKRFLTLLNEMSNIKLDNEQ